MKKAFTLVELLVAVVLLTLLIGTALFSYRQVLLNIGKAERSNFNEILKVHQLRTSIESMQYYVVDEYNQMNQPMKKLHHFFVGNEEYFEYISLNPTLSNIPSLSAFECKENQLLFKEEKLYGRISVNQPQFLEDSKRRVYWKDITECKFHYLFKGNSVTRLKNDIPSTVTISFKDRYEKRHTFVTTIKSDYNLSTYIIDDYLYGE